MTLANYGLGKSKDVNPAKVLSKALQIRVKAEFLLHQHLKTNSKLNDEKRLEIINLLKDYYSKIPFNSITWNKYQTKQCLVETIFTFDHKFNPYKTRDAFACIEQMLINLVHLPWLKEFYRIYLYSGKFRLCISEHIFDVEQIFLEAGYEYQEANPWHLVFPSDKLPSKDETESVLSVIFDCLMAGLVCNNIIEVYESNCKHHVKTSPLALSMSFGGEDCYPHINHYSWIQSYFKERCLQTTDVAAANIQELLNNISNHLASLSISANDISNNKQDSNKQQRDVIGFGQTTKSGSLNSISARESINNNGRQFENQVSSSLLQNRSGHNTKESHQDCNQQILSDHQYPHNDRELLLGRGEHRLFDSKNQSSRIKSSLSNGGRNSPLDTIDSPVSSVGRFLASSSSSNNNNGGKFGQSSVQLLDSLMSQPLATSTNNEMLGRSGGGITSSSYAVNNKYNSDDRRYHGNGSSGFESTAGNSKYWTCEVCTFKNLSSFDTCEMCRSCKLYR